MDRLHIVGDLDVYKRQAQHCDTGTAVLFRNHESALPIIDLCERRGIPYALSLIHIFSHGSGSSFWTPSLKDWWNRPK